MLSIRRFERQGGRKTAAGLQQTDAVVVRHGICGRQDGGLGGRPGSAPLPELVADLMTLKGVVACTGAAYVLTAVMVVLSWTVPPVPPTSLGRSYGIAGGAGSVVGLLVLVQCRRAVPSRALTLAHAVAMGVLLGVLSNTVSAHASTGVFVQFVLGTMTAFAGVLVAYALRWIRVARRRYGFFCAAAMALLLLTVADVLLSPSLGAEGLGFHNVAGGVLSGVAGVALAVPSLALHFGRIEEGLNRGAPRRQAWAAALGLTLTLVWLYVEAVLLISFPPADDL
ncbi:Bax inhibitor-1/YccA family protein [Streptomyces sp. NPDC093970]|uniref:Bax inhibitor-1/YccA family membrane protein n=1 Tax=Streptomyces sp. NPDC093970 TaxID=3155076 RepID=UPI003423DD72